MVAIKHLASKLATVALLSRQEYPCSFVMNAVGSASGIIVEDTIGENRIGGGFPQGHYYMQGHALYDRRNHRCTIDPSSSQFICAQGTFGLLDFSISNDGYLLHENCDKFWACPAGGLDPDGGYDIFSDTIQDTHSCEAVTLRTGGFNCTALGRPDNSTSTASASSSTVPTLLPTTLPATGTAATPTVTPFLTSSLSPSSTSSPSAACPTDLSHGDFQYPHLIVPTSSKDGDHAFGNSYEAYITPINTTIFNFDIPPTYTGTCSLIFLFPYKTDLDASAGGYTFSGTEAEVYEHGGIDFALLDGIASSTTTYNTTPKVLTEYGKTQVIPGNNYTIATFACQAGKTVSYSATSVGNVELDYFQDSAPMPIGLYVVPCV